MSRKRLSVCITSRDREILTSKTIESVIKTTNLFDGLRIYVFDNLSASTPSRITFFSKLLTERKIQYYSYDTSQSLEHCFGKAFIFQRWIKMVKMEKEIRELTNNDNDLKDYYLLLDSDMILGPNWSDYFITACESMKDLETELHFFVKFPGGVSLEAVEHKNTNIHAVKTKQGEEFLVICSVHGGGSGFWFNDFDQLCKLEMPLKNILNTYKRHKGHDIGIWNFIKLKYNLSGVRYVGAVISPDKENPLVLHLGGVLNSSMCNILNSQGTGAYRKSKSDFELKELALKDMTAQEIYDKYKHEESAVIW